MQMLFKVIIILEATANMEKNVVTNITRLLVKKGFVQIENVSLDIQSFVKDQFRQNTFGDESCRGLTMKAMRCLLKGFSLDPFLKIMHFLVFLNFAFIKK